MKIGIVLSSLPQKSETFLVTFIDILIQRHDIVLFSNTNRNWTKTKIEPYIKANISGFLQVPKVLFKLLLNYRLFKELRRKGHSTKQLIHDINIWTYKELDYLHFTYGDLAFNREHYATSMGCKMSISFLGSDLNVYPAYHDVDYSKILELVDKVQCNSRDLKEKVIAYSKKHQEKTTIIVPGLREAFVKAEPQCGSKNQEKNKNNQPLNIITVGRVHWVKGYDIALQALALLKEAGTPFLYRIVGDGPEMEKLKFLVHYLKLENNVMLLGAKDTYAIINQLQESDLYLQTSWAEGLSNTTIEAQSQGLFCVVTPVSGMNECLEQGKTGFITKSHHPQDVYKSLVAAIDTLGNTEAQMRKKYTVDRIRHEFHIGKLQAAWLKYFNE